MTTTGLTRRLDALEDAAHRALATCVAAEYGLDAAELLGPLKRMLTEGRRLRLRGLSEEAVGRGLMEWIATDLGVDRDELLAEWERTRKERG